MVVAAAAAGYSGIRASIPGAREAGELAMGAAIAMSCCPRTMEHMHLLGGFCCAGRGRQGGPQLTGALLAFAPPPTEGASASARAYERVLLECIYTRSRARVASGGGVRYRRLHAIRQDSGGSNAAHMCAFVALPSLGSVSAFFMGLCCRVRFSIYRADLFTYTISGVLLHLNAVCVC